jgi:DNA repair exonuclease SbcCD nuclease subunit
MKIAFTADVHLNPDHPERASALADVFSQVAAEGIQCLVVAGDLFDRDNDVASLKEFERMCGQHPSIQVLVIPGNHDESLDPSHVTQSNVQVYRDPVAWPLEGITLLLVPYDSGDMGAALAEKATELKGKPWILVGHGDYMSGQREPNPLEPGVYMPLTRNDVLEHGPSRVILGHIHKPTPLEDPVDGKVVYVGSPHGLDVSETGRRRFLTYDLESGLLEERKVRTSALFLQERFFVFPADDEVTPLLAEIAKRIKGWGMDQEERAKVRLRVHAHGRSRNLPAVKDALARGFSEAGIRFYKDEGPKLDKLSPAVDDQQRDALARLALEELDQIDFPFGGEEPSFDEVRLVVLETIYGN